MSTEQTCYRREALIPADHPSLPGHFPGQPLVPAVVILDEVAQVLAGVMPGWRVAGIASAKFVAPLLPQQPFEILLRPRTDGASVEFECRRDDQRLAQGRLLLQPQAGQ